MKIVGQQGLSRSVNCLCGKRYLTEFRHRRSDSAAGPMALFADREDLVRVGCHQLCFEKISNFVEGRVAAPSTRPRMASDRSHHRPSCRDRAEDRWSGPAVAHMVGEKPLGCLPGGCRRREPDPTTRDRRLIATPSAPQLGSARSHRISRAPARACCYRPGPQQPRVQGLDRKGDAGGLAAGESCQCRAYLVARIDEVSRAFRKPQPPARHSRRSRAPHRSAFTLSSMARLRTSAVAAGKHATAAQARHRQTCARIARAQCQRPCRQLIAPGRDPAHAVPRTAFDRSRRAPTCRVWSQC